MRNIYITVSFHFCIHSLLSRQKIRLNNCISQLFSNLSIKKKHSLSQEFLVTRTCFYIYMFTDFTEGIKLVWHIYSYKSLNLHIWQCYAILRIPDENCCCCHLCHCCWSKTDLHWNHCCSCLYVWKQGCSNSQSSNNSVLSLYYKFPILRLASRACIKYLYISEENWFVFNF